MHLQVYYILSCKTAWASVRQRRIYFQDQPQILFCFEVLDFELAFPQHSPGYLWMILNLNYMVCIMFVSKTSRLRCLDLTVIWDMVDVVRPFYNIAQNLKLGE